MYFNGKVLHLVLKWRNISAECKFRKERDAMSNVRMALIDDHFLHGQVAELWCSEVESNLIIVVNDKLSENKMQQGLLDMSVPDGITCRYYSMSKAIKMLNKLDSEKHPILIFETIADLKIIMNLGFSIPLVTLSSVAPTGGGKTIALGVSLNSKQINWLASISEQGTKVEVRQTPDEESVLL